MCSDNHLGISVVSHLFVAVTKHRTDHEFHAHIALNICMLICFNAE